MASFGLFVYCTSVSSSWTSTCWSLVLSRYSLSDSLLPWNFQSAWTISRYIEKLRCRYLSDFKEFFFFFDSRLSLLKSIIQKTSEQKHPKIMDLRKDTKWASCQQSSCWYARNSHLWQNEMQFKSPVVLQRPEAAPLGWQGSTELRMCCCAVGGSPQTIPSLSHYLVLETTFTLVCYS